MRHRHDGEPFQLSKPFTQITMRVTDAATEKGRVTGKDVLV
jgi:hypothetical protein